MSTTLAVLAWLSACDYKPRNQGKSLYQSECASCHMEKGQGLGKLIPPLANADFVKEHPEDLACIIRHGIEEPIKVNGVTYTGEMSGNSQLSEVEISNLVHYLMVDLNQMDEPYSIVEVRAQLARCKE